MHLPIQTPVSIKRVSPFSGRFPNSAIPEIENDQKEKATPKGGFQQV